MPNPPFVWTFVINNLHYHQPGESTSAATIEDSGEKGNVFVEKRTWKSLGSFGMDFKIK